MDNQYEKKIKIMTEGDIVLVRKTVRDTAAAMGFGITDVARIVTAASELSRNIFLYADSGYLKVKQIESNGKTGILMIFQDKGPGIQDIDQAMEKGFTTGRGLGLGLPGTRRLMDEMEIQSEVNKGTTITLIKWKKWAAK